MRNEFLLTSEKNNAFLTVGQQSFFKYSRALVLVFLSSLLSGFSQELKETTSIIEKSIYLKSLKVELSKGSNSQHRVVDLLNAVNELVYLNDSQIKIYGNNPVCLITDVKSLPLATSSKLDNNQIELLTITISNPSQIRQAIDFSPICNYGNLKYIYLKLNFDIASEKLIKIIKNCNPKCVIFYSVEKIS